jgi:hypothetical protein
MHILLILSINDLTRNVLFMFHVQYRWLDMIKTINMVYKMPIFSIYLGFSTDNSHKNTMRNVYIQDHI